MNSSSKIVLLIDDDPLVTTIVQRKLGSRGLQINTASDGNIGLLRAAQILPDLIILDMMMPGINGLDVLRALKQDSTLANIPVIMLTARGEESDIVGALDTGAADYLQKPFRPDELVARVNRIIGTSGQASSL